VEVVALIIKHDLGGYGTGKGVDLRCPDDLLNPRRLQYDILIHNRDEGSGGVKNACVRGACVSAVRAKSQQVRRGIISLDQFGSAIARGSVCDDNLGRRHTLAKQRIQTLRKK
jgi:hypothetical protein